MEVTQRVARKAEGEGARFVALAGKTPYGYCQCGCGEKTTLAARFGCSRSNISYIVSGKSWSHLEGGCLA